MKKEHDLQISLLSVLWRENRLGSDKDKVFGWMRRWLSVTMRPYVRMTFAVILSCILYLIMQMVWYGDATICFSVIA